MTLASPKRPKLNRKSRGVPTTTTRSASVFNRPRVRLKASSWSAGMQPRPRPFTHVGTRRCSTAATNASQAPSQYTSVPATRAGRFARAIRRAASAKSTGLSSLRGGLYAGTSPSPSANTTSSGRSREHRAPVRGHGQAGQLRDLLAHLRHVGDGLRLLRDRCQHRDVVELLQGPRTPASLRRTPAQDHERRAVEHGRRHGRDPVRHPRARGQGRHTRSPRQLGRALGGEGRGLLVADVDDADVLLHRGVVQGEDVPAGEREQLLDAEGRERGQRQFPAVPGPCSHAATLGRGHPDRKLVPLPRAGGEPV